MNNNVYIRKIKGFRNGWMGKIIGFKLATINGYVYRECIEVQYSDMQIELIPIIEFKDKFIYVSNNEDETKIDVTREY